MEGEREGGREERKKRKRKRGGERHRSFTYVCTKLINNREILINSHKRNSTKTAGYRPPKVSYPQTEERAESNLPGGGSWYSVQHEKLWTEGLTVTAVIRRINGGSN